MEIGSRRGDLTPILVNVSVPTLVIHRRGDQVPFAAGREIAAKIPGARFLPLEGSNHLPSSHEEAMEIVRPVIEFLRGREQKFLSDKDAASITVMLPT
jgi:pimeloyl-ACP methyl ester carboxylesterase